MKRAQGVIEGVAPGRHISELNETGDRPARIAGLQIMVPELIGDCLLVVAVKLFDCPADIGMQDPALPGHELCVGDAANPVMTEIDSLAIGGQDMAAHQLLDSACRIHFAELSGPRQQREREVTADGGGHFHQTLRQAGQTFQARRDEILNGGRQARLALPDGRTVVVQRPHGFDDDEGIALA